MEKQKLDHYKKIILEKRADLVRQLNHLKESGLNNSARESSGDHSAYSYHMADQGTDTMDREQQYMFASREQNYLYHLDLALERIDKGDFGMCVKCGKEIDAERLEAVPHVRMCVECKEREERLKR
jgi:RNA polymerase-binding protein DksA